MAGSPILSVPFRLDNTGAVATAVQGSDQANAEQIGVILSTIQGERDLYPTFGLPDPAFQGIATGIIAAQVALWGPDGVTIENIDTEAVGTNEQDITVSFS